MTAVRPPSSGRLSAHHSSHGRTGSAMTSEMPAAPATSDWAVTGDGHAP